MTFGKAMNVLREKEKRVLAMGVSGSRVLELVLGEKNSDEELGGYRVHSEITGYVDRVADSDNYCLEFIRNF